MGQKPIEYVLVGSSGYIAPRHIRAIKETGGIITSIIDLDFTEESLELLPQNVKRYNSISDYIESNSSLADYMSICSPNFLHEEQVSLALKANMNVICEKPVALSEKGVKELENIESTSSGTVSSILQLRLHPEILKLKKLISSSNQHKIQLTYVAKRDSDYFKTWKGNDFLSGGMITNVGIHYFDLLLYIFGDYKSIKLKSNSPNQSLGYLDLLGGSVDWLLSFNQEDIKKYLTSETNSYRSITVDGTEIDFSYVDEDLHTISYKEVLNGRGFSLRDAKLSIRMLDEVKAMRS